MTIIADTPDTQQHTSGLLTACDVLAIEKAIVNVAYYGITPDAADRQALALATYWPGCKPLAAMAIRRIFDGYPLPLNQRSANVLLDLARRLPVVSDADEDEFFETHTVAGVTDPEPETLLTAHDVLDIQHALRNVAAADTTSLTAQDRQALALLTYWDQTPSATRVLISWLADPTLIDVTLPLQRDTAAHLLTLINLLPLVTEQDVDDWLAARDTEQPCIIDQIINALALDAATRIHTPEGHVLFGALQTVIRIGKPGVPLDLVPDTARVEIDTAAADFDAAEFATPEQQPEPEPDPTLEALATCAAEYGNTGQIRTTLITAIIATNRDATPEEAFDLAQHDAFDQRVKRAGRIADEMVARIKRDQLTAIDDAPTAVAL